MRPRPAAGNGRTPSREQLLLVARKGQKRGRQEQTHLCPRALVWRAVAAGRAAQRPRGGGLRGGRQAGVRVAKQGRMHACSADHPSMNARHDDRTEQQTRRARQRAHQRARPARSPQNPQSRARQAQRRRRPRPPAAPAGGGGLPAAALLLRRRRAHPAAAVAAAPSSSCTWLSACRRWSCAWSCRRRGTVPASQAPWCGISCAPFCMGREAQGEGQRDVGAGWAAWVLGLVGAAQHALRRPPSGSQHSLVGQSGRTLCTTCDGSARCGAAPSWSNDAAATSRTLSPRTLLACGHNAGE